MGGVDFDPARRRRAPREGGAAQVGDLTDRLTGGEPVRDIADLPLAVAVHQKVGLGVQQHRAPHLLRPIVEMRDAPQRRLDAADDDRHVAERFARPLRVYDHRAVGATAADAAGGVGIVAAHAPLGGVAVDHRVHVAGGDAEEQVGAPEGAEVGGAVPVRLRDDADAKTLCLEDPPDDGHAEARVVDVGIAADDDDVAAVPAERVHLGARHGQKRRRAQARRPVLAIAVDFACALHGTAN